MSNGSCLEKQKIVHETWQKLTRFNLLTRNKLVSETSSLLFPRNDRNYGPAGWRGNRFSAHNPAISFLPSFSFFYSFLSSDKFNQLFKHSLRWSVIFSSRLRRRTPCLLISGSWLDGPVICFYRLLLATESSSIEYFSQGFPLKTYSWRKV